ncbi:hypothetical protein Tco_0190443 [Tanacetum coccineum]
MMYESPLTTPFQKPPRNTTFPFQRYTLVFQQHQDEPIYDAWTRFKNLIKKVHHHGLGLWYLIQFFYDHVDVYTRMDLDFATDGNLRELSDEQAWEAIENFTQGQKELDNPANIIFEQKVANLKAQAKRLFGKVEETLGTPIEAEPLDETQLEDLGLNTYNHDIPLSNREVPSFDEPEPQPNPLPTNASLGVDISNWEMFDDDWGLESKEVSPIGKELSLFDRANEEERGRILEAHRLEHIIQQPIFQHVTPSHNDVLLVLVCTTSEGLNTVEGFEDKDADKIEVGTTTNNLTARLPILNLGDYDLWLMRIEQYFLMTNTLWEVIKNGNKVLRRTVGTVEQEYEPTTAEEKQDRRNEMKARATLLMALPNKDQLKFHSYQYAKLLMKAIKKRYGGNKESKKVQSTLLKQQYENFAALNSESMDQTFDRLQKLISQL